MFISLPMVPSLKRLETCCNKNWNQTKVKETKFENFQNCQGRSIRHIYKHVCFDFTKYMYVWSQFPPNLIFFNRIMWLHLLFNPCEGIPWFLAILERQGVGVLTISLTMFMTVRMYVVTLALPCFSTIFLSATTRVSTFRPFCDFPADLLGRPELPYSSNLR